MMNSYYGADIRYGTSSIDRSLEILPYWEEGMSSGAELRDKVLQCANRPDLTSRSQYLFIAYFFRHRFMSAAGVPWTRVLKRFHNGMNRRLISQICFLLNARADGMVRDFVIQEYWPRVKAGYKIIGSDIVRAFLQNAADEGRGGGEWTEPRLHRLSIGLMSICTGFGLISKTGTPKYRVAPETAENELMVLLAYELHERGLSANAVVSHEDWKLFGLSREDVIERLRSSLFTRYFLVQSSGTIVDISWKCSSMEEAAEIYDRI